MRNPRFVLAVGLCLLLFCADVLAQTSERPRLVVQLGHSSYLFRGDFSPDGRYLATSGDDHAVKLWDAATGVELQSLDHGNQAISVEFSPDGRRVLTNGNGSKLWDIATGKVLREFRFTESRCIPYSSSFTPDGRSILIFGACLLEGTSGFAEMHDVETGAFVRGYTDPACKSARNAVFSPDGSWFATHSYEPGVLVWDTASGALRLRLDTKDARVDALAVSPDGRFILTGANDKSLVLWNAVTGAEVRRFVGHDAIVDAAAFSPDGRLIVSGCSDEPAVRIWDVATGVEVRRFGSSQATMFSTVFTPDGRGVLVVRGRIPILWDVATGTELMRYGGYSNWVFGLAISPDGRYLASGCGAQVNVWDLTAGTRLRTLTGHQGTITSVAFSSDGTRILTGAWDKTVRMWDVATGAELRKFEGHTDDVESVAISPDGTYVASCARDKTTRLWDAITGATLTIVPSPTEELPQGVAFSPDSHRLLVGITGQKGRCEVRAVPSGALLRTFVAQGSDASCVGMTPDGKLIYAAGDLRLSVWSAQTGVEVEHYEKIDAAGLYVAAFSPDLRYILTGGGAYWENSFAGKPALFDRMTRRKVRSFEGHTNLVNTVAWGTDGQFVATGSNDCTVRLWDPATGRELCQLITFVDGTWVVVDPDGRFDTNNLERIPGLHWAMPDDPLVALPVEIFLREYYEPRLLSRVLAGEHFPTVRPLTSLNRVQPRVKILNVSPSKTSPDRVDVSVEVNDVTRNGKKSGVFDLRVFRNGQLVGTAPETGGAVTLDASTGGRTLTFSGIRLPRSAAGSDVVFSAYAFNADRVKSLTARKNFTVPALGPTPVRRAYIVSVGVNVSEDPDLNLRFAANDARRTNEIVVDGLKHSGRFAEVVPVVLVSDTGTEQLASKANLRTVIDLLAGHPVDPARRAAIPNVDHLRPADPDDLVLISFAGHGYADGRGAFYLVPHDVGAKARQNLASVGDGRALEAAAGVLSRCVSSEELGQWLRDVDAGDMALIVDACQSAALTGENFKPGPMGSRGLGQLAYDKGMRILAATQADNVAIELKSLQQGLLTYALVVNGLEGGEADFQPNDGTIGLAEWLQYAVQRVPTLFAEVRSGRVRGATLGDAPRILILGSAGAVQQPALFDFARGKDKIVLR